MYRNSCTDRPVLVRAAGSSPSSIGITLLAGRERLGSCSRFKRPGKRSLLVGAVAAALAHYRGLCSAKLCHGSACACVAKSGCMCFACTVFVVMVGVWAVTGPQKRSSCALPWIMCASMLDGAVHGRKLEIDRDHCEVCVLF